MIFYLVRSKRGFTLVEVVISMAILGILLFSVFSFFGYGNRVFAFGNNRSNLQSNVRSTMEQVNKAVRYATSMTIMPLNICLQQIADYSSSNPEPGKYEYLYIKDSKLLYFKNTSGYAPKVLAYDIDASGSHFDKVHEDILGIALKSKNTNQEYSAETKITLQNFALMQPKSIILGLSSGAAVRFTKTKVSIIPSSVSSVAIKTASGSSGPFTINTEHGTLQFDADVQPYDAKDTSVTWVIDNTAIATIDSNGILKALKNGTVNVTAKANDGSGIITSVMVNIVGQPIIKVESIAIDTGGKTSIPKNKSLTLSYTVTPSDAENKEVIWSVSPSTCGTITKNGTEAEFVPAFPKGKESTESMLVAIWAIAADGSEVKASVPITVTK